MRICVLCAASHANLYARIIPLLEQLKKYGICYDLITCRPANTLLEKSINTIVPCNIRDIFRIMVKEYDVFIISTLSSVSIWLLQRICKSINNKVKILYDACDPIFLSKINILNRLSIRSPAFSHFEKIVKEADFVTASSHYTLKYMKLINRNASVIHDPVDVENIIPKNKCNSNKITIGWEGDPDSHIDNLAILTKPLEKISKEYEIKFKIVSWLGDIRVKQIFKKLEKHAEVDYGADHWVSQTEHLNLCQDFDIMVAPLQSTQWYEGKSAFRVGIGMAMGIPVVASPVGEQKYVIKHGVNAFLARNEEEWYNYLKMLIEDEDLRRRIGREGRKTAEKELSLEVNGRKLYEIIKTIIKS